MAVTSKNKKKSTSRAPLIIALAVGIIVVIGGFALMSGGNSVSNNTASTAPIAVSPTPLSTNNIRQSLETYKGKVVILDFWATWCGPCRSEIPGFIALQNKYRDQGLEVVGVSIDPIAPRGPNGGAGAVAPFMQSFNINYSIFMVSTPQALGEYDVSQGIPTTYVLDRNGSVVRKYIGARPMSNFEEDIKKLL